MMKWFTANKHGALLAAIIAIGVIARLGVAVVMGNQVVELPGLTDQISYHTLANRIIDGYGFTFGENWWPATRAGEPTAHWSYLYTFYLVTVYTLFGPNPLAARILQVLAAGIMQPLLVYLIGATVFNRTVGLVGAALLSGYAYLVYYAPALLTEPFYITALLGTLYLAIRMVRDARQPDLPWTERMVQAVCFGLCIGAAVLLRQLFLLVLPFLFLWVLWGQRKRPGWAVAQLAVAAALLVGMILPFTFYNTARFGTPVLLNTNAGYAFYWANHPIYGTRFESILSPETGSYRDLLPRELLRQRLNEAELEQELMKRGIQFVLDDPGRYALLSLSRVPSYFTFWPLPNSSRLSNFARVASFGIAWPFMLYGLVVALAKTGRKAMLSSPVFLLFLFFGVYSLIHILTWTLTRYRLPVDAVLLVFAAYGLVDLYGRMRAQRMRARRAHPAAAQPQGGGA